MGLQPSVLRCEKKRTADHFASADRDACYLVSIMIGIAGDAQAVPQVVKVFRSALRNLRDRTAGKDRRWSTVEAYGLVEALAMPADDPAPGREWRALLASLPRYGRGDALELLTHVHLVVHAPGLTRDEVAVAFRRVFPGPPQRVDIKPLWQGRTAGVNAAGIVQYGRWQGSRLMPSSA